MSYQAAAALQLAIYGRLSTAPPLAGISIVDAMPSGVSVGTFVLIGPEQVLDQSARRLQAQYKDQPATYGE
ncbi:MAG: hypothetical protein ACOH2M_33105, partial [Cypionkella sp.]